jgi:hypothetical protein
VARRRIYTVTITTDTTTATTTTTTTAAAAVTTTTAAAATTTTNAWVRLTCAGLYFQPHGRVTGTCLRQDGLGLVQEVEVSQRVRLAQQCLRVSGV